MSACSQRQGGGPFKRRIGDWLGGIFIAQAGTVAVPHIAVAPGQEPREPEPPDSRRHSGHISLGLGKERGLSQFSSGENGTFPFDAAIPNALPQPEIISLDGVALLNPVEEAIAAKTTKIVARPIERIDGMFLDAMDSSLVRQSSGRCEKNLSIAKTPILIAGRRYWRGFGVNCPSRIAITLDGKYQRFQALAGLDSAIMKITWTAQQSPSRSGCTAESGGIPAPSGTPILPNRRNRWILMLPEAR